MADNDETSVADSGAKVIGGVLAEQGIVVHKLKHLAPGRPMLGTEPRVVPVNVRAMPSQVDRWRRLLQVQGYRSLNSFMVDAGDVYADLVEQHAATARAAGFDVKTFVSDACMYWSDQIARQRGSGEEK